MIIISHRGNLAGPEPVTENSPGQIQIAIAEGFHVEVDLRCEGDRLWFGHDESQYVTDPTWINDRRDKLFLHLKDFAALKYVAAWGLDWQFICHTGDPYTVVLGQEGYLLWLHDLSLVPDERTLVPLIELEQLYARFPDLPCAGVCTDWPRQARMMTLPSHPSELRARVEHGRWAEHVAACNRCRPSGGYDGAACTEGAVLREAWVLAEAIS